ncbi:MAG: bifunctional diguanylate cyclase/phosphodiesterase, partial [Frankiales bacterium]|nr:bifunctional diguanylate cyclase/phosphodiesterase [Frankiales bacterium]
ARLGGDEFALLVPDYDHAAAEELGRQIRLAIAAPCQLDGVSIEVDVSIGIAVAPDDGTDASVLLKRADMAMYAAKSTHSGVQLYDEERDEYSPRRLALASRLRTAIQTGELVLYYQPQISADSGLATCAEALVRWQHPDYGLVPPSEFVPIAEQTGAIQELTAWVLGESIRQLARWKRDGLELGVSVNVSMRNLLDASTVDTVKDLLARHDVPAERLTIEITETHVMSDPARTLPLLHALAASGVRLSVDDFGTGYSSLASLGRFPVHELKIDKSFIRDPQAADGSHAIIRAIVSMSRHLGLDTVAEGVEDEAAAELLKGFGCTRLQGFHFARPMPAADLPRWYAANRMPRPRAERPALRVVNH